MPNLSQTDRDMVAKTGVPICLGLGILMLSSRYLNALSMGDEEANALGVNVQRVRLTVVICATLVSALTVVIAGTVSWVGLIVPHFTKMITGPDNGRLLPAAAIFGAIYLVAVNDICRLALCKPCFEQENYYRILTKLNDIT